MNRTGELTMSGLAKDKTRNRLVKTVTKLKEVWTIHDEDVFSQMLNNAIVAAGAAGAYWNEQHMKTMKLTSRGSPNDQMILQRSFHDADIPINENTSHKASVNLVLTLHETVMTQQMNTSVIMHTKRQRTLSNNSSMASQRQARKKVKIESEEANDNQTSAILGNGGHVIITPNSSVFPDSSSSMNTSESKDLFEMSSKTNNSNGKLSSTMLLSQGDGKTDCSVQTNVDRIVPVSDIIRTNTKCNSTNIKCNSMDASSVSNESSSNGSTLSHVFSFSPPNDQPEQLIEGVVEGLNKLENIIKRRNETSYEQSVVESLAEKYGISTKDTEKLMGISKRKSMSYIEQETVHSLVKKAIGIGSYNLTGSIRTSGLDKIRKTTSDILQKMNSLSKEKDVFAGKSGEIESAMKWRVKQYELMLRNDLKTYCGAVKHALLSLPEDENGDLVRIKKWSKNVLSDNNLTNVQCMTCMGNGIVKGELVQFTELIGLDAEDSDDEF